MKEKRKCIGVLPIGNVQEMASKVIAAHIQGYLGVAVDILPSLNHPSHTYDESRLQYNATAILKALQSISFDDYEKVIGVLEVDLFVPIFTHVFGEAKQGGKYAVVSLYRLGNDLERAAKVALHELGHLFNLSHCMDAKCLMHFSGGVQTLDETPLNFCKYCAVYFRDALRGIPLSTNSPS